MKHTNRHFSSSCESCKSYGYVDVLPVIYGLFQHRAECSYALSTAEGEGIFKPGALVLHAEEPEKKPAVAMHRDHKSGWDDVERQAKASCEAGEQLPNARAGEASRHRCGGNGVAELQTDVQYSTARRAGVHAETSERKPKIDLASWRYRSSNDQN
eukprot:218522-Pleurochrysis_carterae.AAC.1